jgi:hypothetical protein
LDSDFAKLDLSGHLDFNTLANNIKYVICKELTNIPKLTTTKKQGNNNFRIIADIAPLSDYSYFFAQKMSIDDSTHINAFFDDHTDKIELNVYSNNIDLGKSSIDSLNIHLHNFTDRINLNVSAISQNWIDTTEIKINTNIGDNNLNLNFGWENSVEKEISGEIKTKINFNEVLEDQNINLDCHLLPSTMILADSLWNVREGSIHYNDNLLKVDSVRFDGPEQHLRIDGVSSKKREADLIHLSLKNINLQYLSEVLYMPDIKLHGIASGDVLAGKVLKKPILNAKVSCKQFGLN